MTNRIALILGALLIGLVIVDVLVFGTAHLLFMSKKLFDLIDWVAFWR